MSFIKNSKISQTSVLNIEVLKPLLTSYNNHLLNQGKRYLDKDIISGESYDYLIPNNNKKFYLLITKKTESQGKKYNTLYFFPDEISLNYFKDNSVIKNTIETNHHPKDI